MIHVSTQFKIKVKIQGVQRLFFAFGYKKIEVVVAFKPLKSFLSIYRPLVRVLRRAIIKKLLSYTRLPTFPKRIFSLYYTMRHRLQYFPVANSAKPSFIRPVSSQKIDWITL
jgi:hypothetical protein